MASTSLRWVVAVYSASSNPTIDPPLFYVSAHEAETRITRRFVRFLSPTAVQMKSPDWLQDQRQSISAGRFDSAWAVEWSDRYLVLQMTTRE